MTISDLKIIEITEFGPLVETADGSFTIRHSGHGQDFHSSEGARFEAWELYVKASGYLTDLATAGTPLRVLDVGMGLAYNACATIAAWLSGDGARDVEMISLEIDSRLVSAIAGGQAPWLRGWSDDWLAGPSRLRKIDESEFTAVLTHPRSGRTLSWTVRVGDASLDLESRQYSGLNYIWQDPFTPELNPDMWSPRWFSAVKSWSAPDARMMTYSVSRVVKDALEAGGWSQERFRTPGRKRHWLRAMPAR